MKVTVDIHENEIHEITRITGITKKGPAIRKLLLDALLLERRAEISSKFLSGEWSAELAGFEENKAADHRKTLNLAEAWRD